MAGWYLSEQARKALRDARALASDRRHTALGPPHLLAAIVGQWDDVHAAGPALLRACGVSAEQASNFTAGLLAGYDSPQAADAAAEPRPNPALRFVLAQAFRIAAQARAPYVGTEHLVLAMLWLDYGGGLRRQGISYQQAAEQLVVLPRTEQTVQDVAIEPLEAVAVPAPAAAGLAELARQQAEQHPIEGDERVSTLHHLLALLLHGGASRLLGELSVSYTAVVERLAADGARLVEGDDRRPEEGPLEGWERFDITPQQWEGIHPRVKVVLVDDGLWEQGVRFGFNFNQDKTNYWVIIHPGDSGLTHQQVLDRLLGAAP
jgi:ATP-dependent Clp protease ATP-binding subunit ClpA